MEAERKAGIARLEADPHRGVPEFGNAHEARMWAARNLKTEIGPIGKAGMDVVRETFSSIRGWEGRLGLPVPVSGHVVFDSRGLPRNALATCGSVSMTIREFRTLSDHGARKASIDALSRGRFAKAWTVGTGLESLVVHEAGHAVDFRLNCNPRASALSEMTEGWDPTTVSRYSGANEAEAFAEAFTAIYLDTPEARHIPPRLRDKIERMIYPDE